MWFNDSMNEFYENGIKPAIEKNNFKAHCLSESHQTKNIIEAMIIAIRKATLVIADLTCPCYDVAKNNPDSRCNVYWEAGFAYGLNIPVILTCREDSMHHRQFDIEQFPVMTWSSADELRSKLETRIGVIAQEQGR